jgi:hypothetical protein
VIVAMTGSQSGATPAQLDWFRQRLVALGATELRHGDCIGADALAHTVARELGLRVVIHPPSNAAKRAYCNADLILPARPYLDRNRDLVDAAAHLLALPDGPERQRSGTWSTVRYAQRIGRPVEVELP